MEEQQKLKPNGKLFDSHCDYCKNNKYTCSKNKNGDGIISITLTGTEKCNKRCAYCWHFERLGDQEPLADMDKSHVDDLLDMLDWQFPGHHIKYMALGGEPTMNLPLIDYLMEQTLKRRGTVHCFIITNGKAYVDEMMVLLRKYENIRVQVSLPETREEITDSVKRYIKLQNAADIRWSYVVCENELDDLKDNLIYFKKLGIRRVFLNYEFQQSHEWKIQDKEKYRRIMNEVYDYYLAELKDFNFELDNLSQMEMTPDQILNSSGMPSHFKNYGFEYFADKNFYATHFVNSRAIGNTNVGLNIPLHDRIADDKWCRSCKYTKMCTLHRSLFVQPDLKYKVNPEACFPYIVNAEYVAEKLGVTL